MNVVKEGLTFDDVLLEPQYSSISSRTQVSLNTTLHDLDFSLPIISANMDTVTDDRMALAMAQNGGLGILHRFADEQDVLAWLSRLPEEKRIPSIGIQPEDWTKAELYRDFTDTICIDVAHGDSLHVWSTVSHCRKLGYINVIAGNVATAKAAEGLIDTGATIIKVGVGPGSVCTTRIVTGHGVPQLTAIQDVVNTISKYKNKRIGVIADGGIRTSGDIVKALAAGADAVMLGSLLAGTDESPAAQMGVYRGMASEDAQKAYKGTVSNNAAEGVAHAVDRKGPVKAILEELAGGIRSGLSYSGASNIKELQHRAIFIKISRNGLIESHPHGLLK